MSTYIAEMCGRFTRNYTWEQIHALYRLTALAAIPNLQPRFNACPTDPADAIVEHEGKRKLVEMRWGLVPFWCNKPLKELRLATFRCADHLSFSAPSGIRAWISLGLEISMDLIVNLKQYDYGAAPRGTATAIRHSRRRS